MAAFEELGVVSELVEAINELHWQVPTAVQCDAIPTILGGGDVLIAAETGSGKTAAFSLPLVQVVYETRRDASEGKEGKKEEAAFRCVLSVRDRDNSLAIGSSGLDCESRVEREWNGARATRGVHSHGAYYYEVTVVQDGLCRIGWSTARATLALGTDDQSWGFGGTGKKSHMKRFDDYGESFTKGDVLGCLLNLNQRQLSWSKNGVVFPPAYTLPPSTAPLFPAVLLQKSSLRINFGDDPFLFAPEGFVGVSRASSDCVEVQSAVKSELDTNAPLAIIVEPTYELVDQTLSNVTLFASKLKSLPLRVVRVTGGGDTHATVKQLQKGCDIIVGTVARVVDLMESGVIPSHAIRFLVVDEADDLVGGQNLRQMERMLSKIGRVSADGATLQLIVCSATLHNATVKKFADRFMHFPVWIDLKGMEGVSENVHHVVCRVDAANDKEWIRTMHSNNFLKDDGVHEKGEVRLGTTTQETLSFGTKLLKAIYLLKAVRSLHITSAIVFCRTKQQCDDMEAFLVRNECSAACMHGDRSPDERRHALNLFKKKEIGFLICTDVAARGLDVSGVPYVINVTLPDDPSLYIHRVGRVGRAERMGLSISLVSLHPEKVWYHTCASKGRSCSNRRDVSERGCTVWLREKEMLGEVEEHLGVTIATVDSDFRIPVDEIDGKVVYGCKRVQGSGVEGYASRLNTAVAQLADLERALQKSYFAISNIARWA